jgi:hypothetical protein
MKILMLMALTLGLMVIVCNDPKENHDLIKSVIGSVDDQIVSTGLISDYGLHKLGAALNLCPEPSQYKYSR